MAYGGGSSSFRSTNVSSNYKSNKNIGESVIKIRFQKQKTHAWKLKEQ